jgi:hypothetical protein
MHHVMFPPFFFNVFFFWQHHYPLARALCPTISLLHVHVRVHAPMSMRRLFCTILVWLDFFLQTQLAALR